VGKDNKPFTDWCMAAFTLVLATAPIYQFTIMRGQLDTMRGQLEEMRKQTVLTERPWLKIKQRIVSPLTFNVGGRASEIPVAMMTVEDTIENVGPTAAVDVLSWEDVIPVDLDHSITTARARQKEYSPTATQIQRGSPVTLCFHTIRRLSNLPLAPKCHGFKQQQLGANLDSMVKQHLSLSVASFTGHRLKITPCPLVRRGSLIGWVFYRMKGDSSPMLSQSELQVSFA